MGLRGVSHEFGEYRFRAVGDVGFGVTDSGDMSGLSEENTVGVSISSYVGDRVKGLGV